MVADQIASTVGGNFELECVPPHGFGGPPPGSAKPARNSGSLRAEERLPSPRDSTAELTNVIQVDRLVDTRYL